MGTGTLAQWQGALPRPTPCWMWPSHLAEGHISGMHGADEMVSGMHGADEMVDGRFVSYRRKVKWILFSDPQTQVQRIKNAISSTVPVSM